MTGAFSYSGRAIAHACSTTGARCVRSPAIRSRADPAQAIDVRPLDFSDVPALVRDLDGVTTLYNTYWVRFAHGSTNHDKPSRTPARSSMRRAGRRPTHRPHQHHAPDDRIALPVLRGKALVERALAETGVSYAILRPAILFGNDGVLVNNIAWLLRRLPVFAVGGRG